MVNLLGLEKGGTSGIARMRAKESVAAVIVQPNRAKALMVELNGIEPMTS
jgi:hypothetical protein